MHIHVYVHVPVCLCVYRQVLGILGVMCVYTCTCMRLVVCALTVVGIETCKFSEMTCFLSGSKERLHSKSPGEPPTLQSVPKPDVQDPQLYSHEASAQALSRLPPSRLWQLPHLSPVPLHHLLPCQELQGDKLSGGCALQACEAEHPRHAGTAEAAKQPSHSTENPQHAAHGGGQWELPAAGWGLPCTHLPPNFQSSTNTPTERVSSNSCSISSEPPVCGERGPQNPCDRGLGRQRCWAQDGGHVSCGFKTPHRAPHACPQCNREASPHGN